MKNEEELEVDLQVARAVQATAVKHLILMENMCHRARRDRGSAEARVQYLFCELAKRKNARLKK